MPTYEYRCSSCHKYFPKTWSTFAVAWSSPATCPHCGTQNFERLFMALHASVDSPASLGLASEVQDFAGNFSNIKSESLWKERQPIDQSDFVVDKASCRVRGAADWTIIGASIRGRLHFHEGLYRDDAFSVGAGHGWNFVAVADGAGSSKLARVGARIAVETVTSSIEQKIFETGVNIDVSQMEGVLTASAEDAWSALRREANTRAVDIRELATTLLILAHQPTETGQNILTLQIGDGALIAWNPTGDPVLLAQPMQGQYAGETEFLTHIEKSQIRSRMCLHALLKTPLLLVMTDGVADDFFPFDKYLSKLIEPLSQVIGGQHKEHVPLVDLISYHRPASFDDRTLVIVASSDAQERIRVWKLN